MEYMESRMQDQIQGALHSQQEALERIAQLEADLSTAEQDSRQKQARIERLEKAVKELREALAVMRDEFAGMPGITHDELMACIHANTALKNTEDAV